ncbi:hypothetical protein CSKR_113146 [Clonorchis sinensis]|uniref:Uncharacterized protein n=1 Tax=Clonorchis sinensis TaxID=79923 RepID=A0A419QEI6_CLOSI|nr:hypothetical protein CSKR_113146 [Clonorchis sinensis]
MRKTYCQIISIKTGDSAEFQQLEHEAVRCSTFSCLETSQTGDSPGFQLSLSQSQIDLKMSVFLDLHCTLWRDNTDNNFTIGTTRNATLLFDCLWLRLIATHLSNKQTNAGAIAL